MGKGHLEANGSIRVVADKNYAVVEKTKASHRMSCKGFVSTLTQCGIEILIRGCLEKRVVDLRSRVEVRSRVICTPAFQKVFEYGPSPVGDNGSWYFVKKGIHRLDLECGRCTRLLKPASRDCFEN